MCTKKACAELFRRSRDNGDIYLDTRGVVQRERRRSRTESEPMLYEGDKDPVSGKDLKR